MERYLRTMKTGNKTEKRDEKNGLATEKLELTVPLKESFDESKQLQSKLLHSLVHSL